MIIVMDGLWIIETYDSWIVYPEEAWVYLIVGLGLMIVAFFIIHHGKIQAIQEINKDSGEHRDNRAFIDKMWKERTEMGSKLFMLLIFIFAVISIFDFDVALSLLRPSILIGMTLYGFLFIMKSDTEEDAETDILPKSPRMQSFLRWIDSREHPFSIPFILFLIIVLTFLLSKEFGLILSLETSGNPRYVMSLPIGASITAGLVFASVFIYIIHHCDFFGIRQAKQSDYKMMAIHFSGIITCGATFLIWLVTVCGALFF